MIDDKLIPYATERQAEAVNAYITHGSYAKAAEAIGVAESSCRNLIKRVQQKAATKCWSPEHGMETPVPDPFICKGTTTLYDEEGKKRLQWVKTDLDRSRWLEIMQETVCELKSELTPLPPIEFNGHTEEDQLNMFVMTDAHLGAYGWDEESGAPWDLGVAERTLNAGMDGLIASSPAAHTAYLLQLGDFLHSDGMLPVTPRSGHVLDQSGRYPELCRAGIRILRRNIYRLMTTHERVIVQIAQGNHDESGAVWLQEMFAALFDDNPRVEILVSPLPFYALRHGRCLIGAHHGQGCKPEKLPEVFAGEFRSLMGETDKTFIHCGHRHEWRLFETPSSIVEQHPAMGARDAYASHHGYKSLRMMQCITYHKQRLEIKRCTERP